MGLTESIAALAMDMKSSQVAQNYSIALEKKVMDTQEQLATQMIDEMLPDVQQLPQLPKGEFLDMYV